MRKKKTPGAVGWVGMVRLDTEHAPHMHRQSTVHATRQRMRVHSRLVRTL